MGVELGGWSFGAQFGDLNNDGTQDLYPDQRLRLGGPGIRSYWYDYLGHRRRATARSSRDAKNWPPMQGKSLSGYQQKRVWLNDGAGHFTDVAQAVGLHRHARRPRRRPGRPLEPRRAGRRRGQPEGAAAALQEHGRARERTGSASSWRARVQPQRHRRAGPPVLGRAGAGAGGLRRQRILGPESAPRSTSAWARPRRSRRSSSAGRPGESRRSQAPAAGPGPLGGGARDESTTASIHDARRRRHPAASGAVLSLDNRYLAAAAHHLHPAGGPARLRLPGELLADAAGDRVQHRDGAGPRRGSSSASGRTWPAPTSPGSASAS